MKKRELFIRTTVCVRVILSRNMDLRELFFRRFDSMKSGEPFVFISAYSFRLNAINKWLISVDDDDELVTRM